VGYIPALVAYMCQTGEVNWVRLLYFVVCNYFLVCLFYHAVQFLFVCIPVSKKIKINTAGI